MLYSQATVKSDGQLITSWYWFYGNFGRDMDGDTTEWGWNVALSVKPIDALNISATYRSKVDLDFKDTADLVFPAFLHGPACTATFDAEVSVPIPAVFALSVAYDILDNLNVEFTWDRTFWSTYKNLDFNFSPDRSGQSLRCAVQRLE